MIALTIILGVTIICLTVIYCVKMYLDVVYLSNNCTEEAEPKGFTSDDVDKAYTDAVANGDVIDINKAVESLMREWGDE